VRGPTFVGGGHPADPLPLDELGFGFFEAHVPIRDYWGETIRLFRSILAAARRLVTQASQA
jgi:hypothetical protein